MSNQELNIIDFQILSLLAKRESLIKEIPVENLKSQETYLQATQSLIAPQADFVKQASRYGLSSAFGRKLYRLLLHRSINLVRKRSDSNQIKNVFAIRKNNKTTV